MKPAEKALAGLLLLVAAAALVLHARVFHFFVTDDAYIAFVYCKNLVQHGELVFNLGERVEGYTNFLWTIFLAGFMKLGWMPESSSVVFGIAFAVGTQLVCAWLSRRLRGATGSGGGYGPADALPALLLAAVPGYACWSTGGLETQMFTFFYTLGAAQYLVGDAASASSTSLTSGDGGAPRLRPIYALPFALAALTRPEGNLFFAITLLHRSIVVLRERRLPRVEELLYVGLFLAVVVPYFLWRHSYYGYWLPNTFYIKSSGGISREVWQRGFHYLARVMEDFLLPAFFLPALVAVGLRSQRPEDRGGDRLILYTLLSSAIFFLYIASVAGDFMGLFRFALPVVPLIATAAALGLLRLLRPLERTSPLLPAATVAVLLGLYAWHDVGVDRRALALTSDNGIDTPGYLRWYTEDRAAIGKWFGQYAQPDDFAAVGGAGAQVYFSGMRSLDCFGLSDAYIAHEVKAATSRPGHQKYAPVEYQLSKHPTIITSNYYNIGNAPLVREDAAFWRARGYHYVSAQIPGLSSPWYSFLKRMDRHIGPLGAVNGQID